MKRILFSVALLAVGFGLGSVFGKKLQSQEVFCFTYKPLGVEFELKSGYAYSAYGPGGFAGYLSAAELAEMRGSQDLAFHSCKK